MFVPKYMAKYFSRGGVNTEHAYYKIHRRRMQTIGVLHYLYCSTVLHYYFPVLQCNALQFENMESNAKLHYFFEKVAVQGLHYFFCI